MQVSEDAADSIDKAAGSSTAAAAGLSQDAAAAAAAAGPTTLEAAAAAGAAMSAAFAPVSAAHVAYRQRLDKQERRSARINTLLRKDFLHRICFCGYVYGERRGLAALAPEQLFVMLGWQGAWCCRVAGKQSCTVCSRAAQCQ
jgi:hypothetical protein